MSAIILDGKQLADKIKAEVKAEAEAYYSQTNRKIGLAVILVGSDPASQIYVKNKIKACEENGINSYSYDLPHSTRENELIELIGNLNRDESVHGILVQLPLPSHINQNTVLSTISYKKDADGFLAENAGNLMLGKPGLNACTPCGVIELINSTGVNIDGVHAVVVGRSNIVGKPVSLMLLERNATVTMLHSHSKNIHHFTKDADILVVAIGKKNFITGDMVKKGAVVIDVGMNRDGQKVYGDVDYDSVKDIAGYLTPVPGGVGPMTIAMLLKNVVKAARLEHGFFFGS